MEAEIEHKKLCGFLSCSLHSSKLKKKKPLNLFGLRAYCPFKRHKQKKYHIKRTKKKARKNLK